MARYIDADRLKERLEYYNEHAPMYAYKVALREVESSPSADVEKVKYGKWEYDLRDGVYACSVCGNITSIDSNYCGLCGAKMNKK